jgi:hypothetical protein
MRNGKRIRIQSLYIQLIRDSVPVVVAFTKSDLAFPQIWSESENFQRARSRTCEQLCRPLFLGESSCVSAELVSGDCPLLFRVAL